MEADIGPIEVVLYNLGAQIGDRPLEDTYLHLAQQHRSAWTHEMDLRAFTDLPWWNH